MQAPVREAIMLGKKGNTTEDDIKAHFEHGMLTVTVAKKEAKPAVEEKKHIAIEG